MTPLTPEDAARAADLDALDEDYGRVLAQALMWSAALEQTERLAERLAVADWRGIPERPLDPPGEGEA